MDSSTPRNGAARFPIIVPAVLRRANLWLIAIVAAAFILRLLWALHVEVDPRTYWRWDMTVYDFQAYALARGEGYVDFVLKPTAHWPPGYPAALSVLYRFTDNSLLAARLLNVVAGSLTVVLVYLLGRKVFGRGIGLMAAGLLAVFPGQIFATSLILTEPVFTLLFVLILTIAVYTLLGEREDRPRQAFLIGLLIGVAALVRGEGLLLAAIIPVLIFVRHRSWHATLARSSLLLLGAAIVVLPWTARNVARMHAPIIISTSATEAFWIGHHEGAKGRITDFELSVPADMQNPEKEVRLNNEALRQGLDFIKNNPVEELGLVPRRFVALYWGDGSSIAWHDNPSTLTPEKSRMFARLSDGFYWVIGALAALGLPTWLSLRDRRKALLVAVVACWTLLFSIVFFGDERFHFSIMPIFCLWAAVSLTALGQLAATRWRSRTRAAST